MDPAGSPDAVRSLQPPDSKHDESSSVVSVTPQNSQALNMTKCESQHINMADSQSPKSDVLSPDSESSSEVGTSRKRRTVVASDGEVICNKRICLERDSCQCSKADRRVPGSRSDSDPIQTPGSLDKLKEMVTDSYSDEPSTSTHESRLEYLNQTTTVGTFDNDNASHLTCLRDNRISYVSANEIIDSSESDSDMEIIEPAFSQEAHLGDDDVDEGSASDGQMFIRWHNRHVAKAIVDNAINKTIEEMGLGPSPPPGAEAHQRRVEDQGVSEAIRQWGLRRQSPFYASHLSPIINRLTEVSENLFSRALYRPVVSRNIRPQPSTSSSGLDLESASSSTQLTASTDLKDSQGNLISAIDESVSNFSNSEAVDLSVHASSHSQPDSPNRSDILDEAVTIALSQSGLACAAFDQHPHLS